MKHLITALLILALTAGAAFAQRGGHGFEPGMDNFGPHPMMQKGQHGQFGPQGKGDDFGHLLRFADEINLSEEQRQTLKDLRYEFKMEQIDRQAEVEKAGVTLRALMRDDDADERHVFEAIDKAAVLKADLHKMRYAHRKQMRDVLTEEQRAKLKELRWNRGDREIEERKVIRRRMKKG